MRKFLDEKMINSKTIWNMRSTSVVQHTYFQHIKFQRKEKPLLPIPSNAWTNKRYTLNGIPVALYKSFSQMHECKSKVELTIIDVPIPFFPSRYRFLGSGYRPISSTDPIPGCVSGYTAVCTTSYYVLQLFNGVLHHTHIYTHTYTHTHIHTHIYTHTHTHTHTVWWVNKKI